MTQKIILTTALLILCNAEAQEIGIAGSQAWTDNVELGNPYGIGLYVSENLTNAIVLKVGYDYFSNDRTYVGVTSDLEIVAQNPVSELIQSSTQAKLWNVTLLYEPLRFDWIHVEMGPSVTTSFFSIQKRGTQTGRDVSALGGQKFGLGYLIRIRMEPMAAIPIAISIAASGDLLGYSGSATDVETPFFSPIRFTVLRLSVGYSFRK
jgi:hypothetical protein